VQALGTKIVCDALQRGGREEGGDVVLSAVAVAEVAGGEDERSREADNRGQEAGCG
jgi:hypothetical protein